MLKADDEILMLKALLMKYFYINQKTEVFFQFKSSYLSELAVSASFEYLYYGSTAIINILLLQCEDRF